MPKHPSGSLRGLLRCPVGPGWSVRPSASRRVACGRTRDCLDRRQHRERTEFRCLRVNGSHDGPIRRDPPEYAPRPSRSTDHRPVPSLAAQNRHGLAGASMAVQQTGDLRRRAMRTHWRSRPFGALWRLHAAAVADRGGGSVRDGGRDGRGVGGGWRMKRRTGVVARTEWDGKSAASLAKEPLVSWSMT